MSNPAADYRSPRRQPRERPDAARVALLTLYRTEYVQWMLQDSPRYEWRGGRPKKNRG